MHKDWYICESEKRVLHGTELALDFYNGEPDVLDRCTFLAHPIPQNDNKLKNCKDVIGPVKAAEINGQPLPHPPHLVPKIPPSPAALPTCIPVCPATESAGTTIPTGVTEAPTTPSLSKSLKFSFY